jgi:cytochrome c553
MLNLHFHHVDPSAKSFNMTMASGKSEAAYLAEARKCVLVCANCHGEIEAGLIESPPSQDGVAGPLFVRNSPSQPGDGQLGLDLG